jgi:hypothetical protein
MATKYKRRNEKIVGLLVWMGFMQFLTIADYWSQSFLYKNATSRNQF